MSARANVVVGAFAALCAGPVLAALGGAAGVQIPYAGKLELNGVLANGSFDFQFQIMVDATTSTACDTKTVSAVTVTNGELAVTIPAVLEACVRGKDVHVIVGVRSAGGGAFTILGKQRVAPALAAMTSGTGDFNTAGQLQAASAVISGALVAVSASMVGATSTATLSATTSVTSPNYTVPTLGTINFIASHAPWTIQAADDLTKTLSFTSNDAAPQRQVSFDGTLAGGTSIRARAQIVSNTTPDLAETIAAAKDVEAADVVCADPQNAEHVVRCGADAHGILGVISDGTSSFLINSRSHDIDAPLTGSPLTLAGRVPVKVSRENGPIHIGDELALSTTPGVAMRATGTGPVVGIALADFDAKTPGTVLCFVKVAEANVAALARDNTALARNNAALSKRVDELEAAMKHMAALNANAPEASR